MCKLVFSFDTFSIESFTEKLLSVEFKDGVKYYLSLASYTGEQIAPVVSFTYYESSDKIELSNKLFNNIQATVSYLELQYPPLKQSFIVYIYYD